MALNVKELEGNEIADGYVRTSVPKGRWGDTWDVFKSNFAKLVVLNLMVLVTCVPAFLVIYFRILNITALGTLYPFNTSIIYPYYPNVTGLSENVTFSADVLYYGVFAVALFVACVGISGAVYTVRKMLQVHVITTYKELMKSFFHGVRVNYFSTLLPALVFYLFFYFTVLIGDRRAYASAVGSGVAGWTVSYVFIIIATVLVGLYAAWIFSVGTSFRVKLWQLIKNSFLMMIGTPIQTIFMAGFSLIPVWLMLMGSFFRIVGVILSLFFGFSFVLLSWMSFSQWVFDMYITPNIKAEQERANAQKSPKELAKEQEDKDRQTAMEMLAVGKSELIARPIMPVAAEAAVRPLGKTFNRADLGGVEKDRQKLVEDIAGYEKEHEKDPVFVEYNKLFAEREKALTDDNKGKKKGKAKKISSDNLLK